MIDLDRVVNMETTTRATIDVKLHSHTDPFQASQSKFFGNLGCIDCGLYD